MANFSETLKSPRVAGFTSERQATVLSAVLMIMLGAFVLYGVALAQPAALHDAAHDARHAFSFPCH